MPNLSMTYHKAVELLRDMAEFMSSVNGKEDRKAAAILLVLAHCEAVAQIESALRKDIATLNGMVAEARKKARSLELAAKRMERNHELERKSDLASIAALSKTGSKLKRELRDAREDLKLVQAQIRIRRATRDQA